MYYDKRIRYLSYYESDIKLQNAGYAKFQVRDSLCQMVIYVKGPRLMGNGEAAVYLLSRMSKEADGDSFYPGGRDSGLRKHLLGNLSIRGGQGHCAVRMNAENMAESGLRYDEICGIRIELHEYQYLESQWSAVNPMPERERASEGKSMGYQLRQPQNVSRYAKSGDSYDGDGRMREGAQPREESLPQEEPVKVNLIVTPVSENVRVEKLVREDPMEEPVFEEIRREEISREAVFKEAEEKTIKEDTEDSMQGIVEREVRKDQHSKQSAEIVREESPGLSEQSQPLVPPIQIVRAFPSEQSAQTEPDGDLQEEIRTAGEEIFFGEQEAPQEICRNLPEDQEAPQEPRRILLTEQEAPQEPRRSLPTEQEASQEPCSALPTEQEVAQKPRKILPVEQKTEQEDREILPAESETEEQELKTDKWEQLRNTYPIVHPIREEEEYLKVSPRDFVIFTEKYQQLVHNSFLLHGYHNYKHLILGKKEKDGKVVYYLGVPGTFHDREKAVAVMFGFEAFDGKREPAQTGDFGYYLRRVEL